MTIRADNSAHCDRCGTDIGNAGIDKCVVISALTDTGTRVETLHLCTVDAEGKRGCASRVLTKASLAWYVDNVREPGETPRWFVPETTEESSEQ